MKAARRKKEGERRKSFDKVERKQLNRGEFSTGGKKNMLAGGLNKAAGSGDYVCIDIGDITSKY